MVGRFEIGKDTVQVITESAATHVGRIATIVTTAVREVAHEVGEWATDAFEMRDAANRASTAERTGTAERAGTAADSETPAAEACFDSGPDAGESPR